MYCGDAFGVFLQLTNVIDRQLSLVGESLPVLALRTSDFCSPVDVQPLAFRGSTGVACPYALVKADYASRDRAGVGTLRISV